MHFALRYLLVYFIADAQARLQLLGWVALVPHPVVQILYFYWLVLFVFATLLLDVFVQALKIRKLARHEAVLPQRLELVEIAPAAISISRVGISNLLNCLLYVSLGAVLIVLVSLLLRKRIVRQIIWRLLLAK